MTDIIDCGLLTYARQPGRDILRRFNWRHLPLTFAVKLKGTSDTSVHTTHPKTEALLVAGSLMNVDIWLIDAGKIVHIFETKKDRIKSLDYLLVQSGYKLYLLADEDKDGQRCTSIITIYRDDIKQ